MKTVRDSNEEYHSRPGISASGLKMIYKESVNKYLKRKPFESKSMALGTAVHSALLEPDEFSREYLVLPKIDRRTKDGKNEYNNYMSKANNKTLLASEDYNIINEINKNLKKNKLAKFYLEGQKEISHYGQYNNIDVRVRPDVINMHRGYIADVKTCRNNSPKNFKSDVYKYAYHLQAAFYMDMIDGIDHFKFITVETVYPYTVEVYTLSDEMIEQGRNAWKQAFSDYEMYLETGVVPSYNWYQYANDGSYLL